MLIYWSFVKRLSPLPSSFWRQIRFSTHECLDASKQIVAMETVIYLSGYVSTCSKKRKMQKRHQCIVGALPSTHFNAHPLCLGIHVRNCLRDSRGSLEAGCGSWNWINFKSSPHMVIASPSETVVVGGGAVLDTSWTTARVQKTTHLSVCSMWPYFIKCIPWIFLCTLDWDGIMYWMWTQTIRAWVAYHIVTPASCPNSTGSSWVLNHFQYHSTHFFASIPQLLLLHYQVLT